MLDLVEHRGPVRKQSHAIHGGGGGGHSLRDRPKPRQLYSTARIVAPSRAASTGRRTPARPPPAPSRRRARRSNASGRGAAPAPRTALPRLLRRQMPAHAVALRPRERRLDQQQIGVPCERAQLVVGRAIRREREPGTVAANSTALDGMKCGTGWNRTVNPPTPTVGRVVDRHGERQLDVVGRHPARTAQPRERLERAGRREQARPRRMVGAGVAGDGDRLLARRVAQPDANGTSRGCGRRAGG